MNEKTAFQAQDTQIIIVIWVSLLAALIYTSGQLFTLILAGSNAWLMSGRTLLQYPQTGLLVELIHTFLTINSIPNLVGLALMIVDIALLGNTWRLFMRLTTKWAAAYQHIHESDKPIFTFHHLLTFEGRGSYQQAKEGNVEPDDAQSTLPSDIIYSFAYTWIAMLAASPLFSILVDLIH